MEEARNLRKTRIGRVVSDKMDKTIVVAVESLKKHRIYKRTYRQTKRFHAHDEKNVCEIGDIVRMKHHVRHFTCFNAQLPPKNSEPPRGGVLVTAPEKRVILTNT